MISNFFKVRKAQKGSNSNPAVSILGMEYFLAIPVIE